MGSTPLTTTPATTAAANTAPGRPRDPSIEPAVLATTKHLLGTVGFVGTTVQAISRESGVNVPAIYRRWPSRLALIEDAAFSQLTDVDIAVTGDLRSDLTGLVDVFENSLGTPAARAAIPGLIAAYQSDAPPPAQWLKFSVRPQFYAIVEAAGVKPEIDLDEVFDILHGTILARIFVPLAADHHRRLDTVVEMLVRILTNNGTSRPT